MIASQPLLVILSSPSGAGKTTIARQLLEKVPSMEMSISVTTRPKRPGEQDGVDYHFVSPETFQQRADQGEFLEHATVFENEYGTLSQTVTDLNSAGKDVLFDIDWQGAQQITQKIKLPLVKIFILPPSVEILRERLENRRQDSKEIIDMRMEKALTEMSHWPEYDYILVNDDLKKTTEQALAIISAARCKKDFLKPIS